MQWEGEVFSCPFQLGGQSSASKRSGQPVCGSFLRTIPIWNNRQGLITITTGYHLDAASSPMQMTLDGLKVSLSDLSLQLLHADKAFLQLKKVDLDAPHFDLATRQLHVGSLQVEKGAVDVRINETGGLNLQQIVRASEPAEHRSQKPSPPDAPPAKSMAGADQKTASPPTHLRLLPCLRLLQRQILLSG